MNGKSCVVIPAYNAAKTIGPLIRQVKQLGLDTIVVNDGSLDETARVASEAGAFVMSHLRNRGKGLALRTGFDFALKSGYERIVTMDSDGQHDPSEIPRLMSAGEGPGVAIVIGHRVVDKAQMPAVRRITNRVMSWIVSKLTGQQIPDSQCGFRVIRRDVLQTVKLSTTHYDLETELLLAAACHGLTIVSVAVRTIYHEHPSHIHPLWDGARFIRLILWYGCSGRQRGTRRAAT